MPENTLRSLASLALLLVGSSCATHWALKPASEKPEERGGTLVVSLVTPKCVIQAGFQEAGPQEIYLLARVTNKSPLALDVSPTGFALHAKPEVLTVSPNTAVDPEAYVKELNDRAEVMDARSKLDTYQGIEEMSALNNGKGKDAALDAVEADYEKTRKEAEASKKEAVELRARAEAAKKSPLKAAKLASGRTAEGRLIFKSAFAGEGPVTLVSDLPGCEGELRFNLEK
jgi:hypothetical protein